jgi:hypothetical protein
MYTLTKECLRSNITLNYAKTKISKTSLAALKVHKIKKFKGKAISLQVWTDPEGFRRLRLPDFKTIGT